jgi:protein-S-isoprenylcysteine O-methyltransferase Ste14
MYVSVMTILIGEATLFKSPAIMVESGIFMVFTYLFVVFYEEPALRRQFGESYERYTQAVGRWIPRSR